MCAPAAGSDRSWLHHLRPADGAQGWQVARERAAALEAEMAAKARAKGDTCNGYARNKHQLYNNSSQVSQTHHGRLAAGLSGIPQDLHCSHWPPVQNVYSDLHGRQTRQEEDIIEGQAHLPEQTRPEQTRPVFQSSYVPAMPPQQGRQLAAPVMNSAESYFSTDDGFSSTASEREQRMRLPFSMPAAQASRRVRCPDPFHPGMNCSSKKLLLTLALHLSTCLAVDFKSAEVACWCRLRSLQSSHLLSRLCPLQPSLASLTWARGPIAWHRCRPFPKALRYAAMGTCSTVPS